MKTLNIRKFLIIISINKQQPTAFLFEGFSSSVLVIAELWACGEITFWPCLFSMGGWLRFRSHRGGCVGYFNELPASEWWIGVSELSVCSTPSEGSTTRVLVSRALCFPHTYTHTHIFMYTNNEHTANTHPCTWTHNQCNSILGNKSKTEIPGRWETLKDERANKHHPEPNTASEDNY